MIFISIIISNLYNVHRKLKNKKHSQLFITPTPKFLIQTRILIKLRLLKVDKILNYGNSPIAKTGKPKIA